MLDTLAATTGVQVDKGGLAAVGIITLVIVTIVLVSFILWIYALLNILTNKDFKDPSQRILWFVVVFFLHAVGAIIYLLLGKPRT
ncbi:MAG: hypothetical protein UU23_C0001G0080 [Candidatus Curtissbacteria bacterium GW2011_GWA1_40_9]|uniref:Cardiolipin synthase N-terminal domain-containing protein n=1 Tax=Candidatus Curtissbacteria bacterium GW2011_GWA1_40_9 TaxID=1618408 RepID=A0A0G0TU12_9BACT|nr:MAG: hypothetical protein UU23_C0001G0080 [Candidatus Curtissbacteria bacterium GW2011_GWA1_40_9]